MKIGFRKLNIQTADFLFFGLMLSLILYPFHGFDVRLSLPIVIAGILSVIMKWICRNVKNQAIINSLFAVLVSVSCGVLFRYIYSMDRIILPVIFTGLLIWLRLFTFER